MQFKRFRHIFYAVRFHCGTEMRTYVGRKIGVVAYGETLDELTKSPRVVEADHVVEGVLVTFEVESPRAVHSRPKLCYTSGEMTGQSPTCYIIAGPNGAGKTTFALNYLPNITDCRDFINVDEIAKGLSPLDFESGLIQAGKIFLSLLDRRISQMRDFAFETTLSGRSYLTRIDAWRARGWKVVLIYLYIPGPEFSESRVSQRVLQGGHNIPVADINRRYPRSLRNLFSYVEHCDVTFCFDNSQNKIVPIFEKRNGGAVVVQDAGTFSIMKEFAGHE